jgi:hypothetical protein
MLALKTIAKTNKGELLKPGKASKFWGPFAWFFLHALPHLVSRQLLQSPFLWKFLLSFRDSLPCKICREHFTQYLRQRPHSQGFANRRQFSDWLNEAHNRVSRSYNKRHPEEKHKHKPTFTNKESWSWGALLVEQQSTWVRGLLNYLYFVCSHYPDAHLEDALVKRTRRKIQIFFERLVLLLLSSRAKKRFAILKMTQAPASSAKKLIHWLHYVVAPAADEEHFLGTQEQLQTKLDLVVQAMKSYKK